jgi:hypothetical protein
LICERQLFEVGHAKLPGRHSGLSDSQEVLGGINTGDFRFPLGGQLCGQTGSATHLEIVCLRPKLRRWKTE